MYEMSIVNFVYLVNISKTGDLTCMKRCELLEVIPVYHLPSFLLPQSVEFAYLHISCQFIPFTCSLFTCSDIQWQGLSLMYFTKFRIGSKHINV